MIKKIIEKIGVIIFFTLPAFHASSQLRWTNVDSLYQSLPSSVHVYFTNQPIDTAPFRAFYLIADLKDKNLLFDADTTLNRRLTPNQFYQKNKQPLVVVNCTFFSFQTNQNLNVVIKEGKLVSYNIKSIKEKVGDTTKEIKVYRSAIGINKKRKADIAWIRTDSIKGYAEAVQEPDFGTWWATNRSTGQTKSWDNFSSWNMQTAVGGGPVLLQNGNFKITNNEEKMFTGKAIYDKHPRTAMGYTKDGKLIILMIEGRNAVAHGATLTQEAQILKDLGCREALNLDGGGSSCMLVNGIETIKPSDTAGQRPIPAVFVIRKK